MAETPSNTTTLKEYGRGIIGGLIFSLPLIYTMEIWWAGYIAPPGYLLSCIIFTYLLLLGYNRYAGMKEDASFLEVSWDSVEEIGLAFVVSFIFLLLLGRINFGMSFDEIAGKVIIESMVVAIGISVGTAQLGQNEDGESGMSGDSEKKGKEDGLLKMLILSICGAVLFASSVAPTEEILMLGVESSNLHLLLMVISSLLLGAIIIVFSDFKGSSTEKPEYWKEAFHLAMVYVVALFVSYGFLYFFGRVEDNSWSVIVAQVVVLAIPATIGASAGRFLIEG